MVEQHQGVKATAMEKLGGSKQKSPKAAKAKKKPVKVVYISNPMRVEASASEFKGVVQELTGQDSDISDLSKFADGRPETEAAPPEDSPPAAAVTAAELHLQQQRQDTADMFDEIFTPQVLEDLAGIMPPGPFYEAPSPHLDGTRRKRDGQ